MAEQGLQQDLAADLLGWYAVHARVLPWRARSGARPDPYRVWLSEIMLQQTTVTTVKDYFNKFIALWPNVESLAEASQDEVMRAWAGLGYYARARNLHACAMEVAGRLGGRFPETESELRTLPGIGPYTAAAIAAIAFGQPVAAVDGNVERVMSRLWAIDTPLPASRPEIRQLAASLVPHPGAGDFAQALMDLGATICRPRNPDCPACPWQVTCRARARGIAGTLPRKAPRRKIPTRRGVAFWVEREDGAILLRRRPEKGLLGGMMEIPSTDWLEGGVSHIAPPLAADWIKGAAQVDHTFTHFHLQLEVWRAQTSTLPLTAGNHVWVHRDSLHSEALPAVMRKIIAAMIPAPA